MYAVLSIVVALAIIFSYLKNKRKLPPGTRLPPGPKGLPFIGEFFRMKQIFHPDFMFDWKKKYGDIISINVFGHRMVFIYSPDIARDLFEKRGAIYSTRPIQHMMCSLGWDFSLTLMPYSDWWRRHIRAFHQYFNSRAVLDFTPLLSELRGSLLRNLLQTPADFVGHINYATAHIVLDTMYSIDIRPKNDPYIDLMHHALGGAAETMVPGAYIVDWFPIFKRLPDWIPCLPFKKVLRKYGRAAAESIEIPFAIVKNQKNPRHSFVSASLERLYNSSKGLSDSDEKEEERVIKNVAGIAYAAGAGTTSTGIVNGVLASILHPEAQKKAQAELDEVLGDRLPTVEDRESLPFINAYCDEILRWRSIAPVALPHAVIEDDIYGNYFIPKGSIIIGDTWQMLHSEKYGPEPTKFNPDRFFEPGVPAPVEQFGFGRRMCPGRFLANNTVFLYIASMLKVFDIVPAKDANGNDIPIPTGIVISALPQPEPFQCEFKLRSSRAKQLIEDGI